MKGKDGLLSKQVKVSKHVLAVWHQATGHEVSSSRTAFSVLLAVVLHLSILSLTSRLKNMSTESAPQPQSVRVSLAHAPQRAAASELQKPAAPAKTAQKSQRRTDVLTAPQMDSESPQDESVPTVPFIPPPTSSPQSKPAPSSLLEERHSPLLPSGVNDFVERQRKLGDVMGAGAIAGDLEIPDVVTEDDPDRPVRKTEFTFAGYFDSLSRRFVEAWGGVRTLPAHSQFEGKLGEFIEYDVVINRDGSLRKIINITARREPYRDFSAVDDLVMGVFKSLFPFQPVPDRIRNDPLVIRKRIQFVGFKYTLY
ncbi:MAG: hypothetical protein RIR26_2090 [Pseudomonadota bacterium]